MDLYEIMQELDSVMKKLEETKQWDLSMRLSKIYESLKNWQVADAGDE